MTPIQIRAQLVKVAVSQIGVKEIGMTNDQKYGAWFGFNKVAWCMIFQSWLFAQVGRPLKNTSWAHGYASVPEFLQKNKSMITKSPQMGDLIIYDWQLDGAPDHVGMFVCWIDQAERSFLAIEGNTEMAGDQSDGGEVMGRADRDIKNVEAFIDISSLIL